MNRALKKRLLWVLRRSYGYQTWKPSWHKAHWGYRFVVARDQEKQIYAFLGFLFAGIIAVFLLPEGGITHIFQTPSGIFFVISFILGPGLSIYTKLEYPLRLMEFVDRALQITQRRNAKETIAIVFDEIVLIDKNFSGKVTNALSRTWFGDIILDLSAVITDQLYRYAGQISVREIVAKKRTAQQGLGIGGLRQRMLSLAEAATKCGIISIPDMTRTLFQNKIIYHSDWTEFGLLPPTLPQVLQDETEQEPVWFYQI